jgi:hypothetical protein
MYDIGAVVALGAGAALVCATRGLRGRLVAVTGRHILGWSAVAALLWVPGYGPALGQSTEAPTDEQRDH